LSLGIGRRCDAIAEAEQLLAQQQTELEDPSIFADPKALQERLREQLIELGLDKELPLPA